MMTDIERTERKISERALETKLVRAVIAKGGICPKLMCPAFAGMPDRLILMPEGKMAFAELKVPGKKPRPLQLARHALLRGLGFRVYVIDGAAGIAAALADLTGGRHADQG